MEVLHRSRYTEKDNFTLLWRQVMKFRILFAILPFFIVANGCNRQDKQYVEQLPYEGIVQSAEDLDAFEEKNTVIFFALAQFG